MTKENHSISEHANAPLSHKQKQPFMKYLDFAMLTEEGAIKVRIL